MFQKHIIDLLRVSDEQHYAQLQPEGVESSHFKYHLNQLIKDGYVEQKGRGVYALSAAGLAFVDTLSEASVVPEAGPKVITYSLLKNDTYYFLQTKQKEPYRGLINMIGGKVHIGETTTQAAIREVKEKAGLEMSGLEQLGVAEILIHGSGTLISHVIAYVYELTLPADFTSPKLVSVLQSGVGDAASLAPDLLPIISASKQRGFTLQLSLDM